MRYTDIIGMKDVIILQKDIVEQDKLLESTADTTILAEVAQEFSPVNFD